MATLTKKVVAAGLDKLSVVFHKELTEDTIDVYAEALQGIRPDCYLMGVNIMIKERTNKFFPVPAEILEFSNRAADEIKRIRAARSIKISEHSEVELSPEEKRVSMERVRKLIEGSGLKSIRSID